MKVLRLNATSTQTYSRGALDYAAPAAEMIELVDLQVPLFRHPRFVGHLSDEWEDWKVGHHLILCSRLVSDPYYAAEALMHDGAEAYTCDLPSPLKKILGEAFKVIERSIDRAIAERFGLVYPWPKVVKEADMLAQDIEATMMLPGGPLDPIVRPGFVLEDWHRELVYDVARMNRDDFACLFGTLMQTRTESVYCNTPSL